MISYMHAPHYRFSAATFDPPEAIRGNPVTDMVDMFEAETWLSEEPVLLGA